MATTRPDRAEAADGAAFARVLCGIDGGRADREVVRQAAAMAGSGTLTLVSVAYRTGVGLDAQAALGPSRANEIVEAAAHEAVGLAAGGPHVETKVLTAPHVAAVLLKEARGHDLLVVGSWPGSRAGGIFLGSTSSALVHRAPLPVLVARRPPEGVRFPERVLLATDGSESSFQASHIAARIAAAHGSQVLILRVGELHTGEQRLGLAAEAAEIFQATGTEPVVSIERGDPGRRVVEVADRERESLIVVGSRGVGGLKALGSVSERVAQRAHSSVLVARERR